jgi:hypothetical protein
MIHSIHIQNLMHFHYGDNWWSNIKEKRHTLTPPWVIVLPHSPKPAINLVLKSTEMRWILECGFIYFSLWSFLFVYGLMLESVGWNF